MSASDIAAWYAAIIATAILIWDVIKFKKSGPQLRGEAHAGWESYGIAETEDDDLTIVKVTNTGDRPTTLTSWGLYWYPAGASLNDSKSRKAFVIQGGLAGLGKIPTKLEPGDEWTGLIKENDEYENMFIEGTLLIGLGFSHTDEEFKIKVEKSANKAN